MKITEYWARLVASGLAPDCENVFLYINRILKYYSIRNDNYNHTLLIKTEKDDTLIFNSNNEIQLRKDSVDLYHLEWRKPTEQDIGKMCWFYNDDYNAIVLANLEVENGQYRYDFRLPPYDCLLANHGQIAPTAEDFKQVYGGLKDAN